MKYAALHLRVQTIRGTDSKCDTCGTTDPERAYDWANLTGNYADPWDYDRLCRSCHWKLDNKVANLGKYAQRKEVAR